MASSRIKVQRTCICGTEFETSELHIERGWGKFCSHRCYAKFGIIRPIKVGAAALRKRARKIWIERHGSKPVCWCGKAADVHHDDGHPENNAPENQVPLCRSHHTTLENLRRIGRCSVKGSTHPS